MKREFGALRDRAFDLLVIGGGIYGAWTAYDAALRGLRVALVEKDDWSSGTSSASSKLIHGGLRYLEYMRFGLVRKSLDERRRLWRLAPHRVSPLRFVLPVYRGTRLGRWTLGAGLFVYDLLGGRGQPVPRHRSLSRERLLRGYGFLEPDGLSGGFRFGDCQTDDARFTLEIVDGAAGAGAVALNRARACELLLHGKRVTGARVEDLETGESLDVRAGVTVGCAGPWIDRLIGDSTGSESRLARLSKGVHLLLPALPTDDAFLLASDDGRVVFVIPWYGHTLLGTTDTEFDGDPDRVAVDQEDVDFLLENANRALHGIQWTEDQISGSFAGLRALPDVRGVPTSSVTRELSVEQPLPYLITTVGGKYTSARADAAEVVDRVVTMLGRRMPGCATAERPFPWCPEPPFEAWVASIAGVGRGLGFDEKTLHACLRRYGTRIHELFDAVRDEPRLAERIVAEEPFCLAEVAHAVRHEMARDLTDVLRRRVPLLLLRRLSREELARVAEVAVGPSGWTAERTAAEIEKLTLADERR